VDSLLRLRSTWYRQTPLPLKRVKAHASRREPFTFVLWLLKLGDFDRTRTKSKRFIYMSLNLS